ncbi:hypothetical protein ANN_03981 [Periplaneta americana]|uniref:Uncharacterized protein n=1 Tax=Periplaneta americana TaxID=6978 RepID=A0ABQ8T9P4_PERAM|nr:hypothetical protein ANN_03981 [Periplaneta americana]
MWPGFESRSGQGLRTPTRDAGAVANAKPMRIICSNVVCTKKIRSMPGKYAVYSCNNQEIQKDSRSFFRFLKNKPQKVQDNRQDLELNGLYRLLVYEDNVNMLGQNPQTIRENTEILLQSK